jgi:dipeptidyl aminopeptidase/acylaminoacyl peptidase
VTSNGVKVLKLADRHHFETIAIVNRYLEDVQPARVQPLAEYLPDGRRVMHWLYLPATSPERRKLPLVVVPYPGQVYGDEPPASQAPGVARFQASAQILASHGYAVLLPSLPSDASGTDRMPGFVRAVDRAVDAAVATGMIDPRRLILWGHSHGAFATAMIVSRTNRYAAAITAAGVYDPGAATGIFGPTMRFAPELGLPIGTQFAWAETGQGGFGAPPWSDPQAYVALSPLYRANRISTPMLIIGADRDSSPLQQAEQLFSALFRQNKDAELLSYWGEGHVIGSPANVRDLYDRVFTWLDVILSEPHPEGIGETASAPTGSARHVPNAP